VHRVGDRHSFAVRAAPYYRRVLLAGEPDVVVEDLNKIPLFARFWADRPLALLVHHLFGATAFREAPLPIAAATWLLERPIGRAYRGVPTMAVSESTRDDLVARGLHGGDIAVIHNGVDLAYFSPDGAASRFEEPTFVYMGRLRKYKSIDLAVRAVARLRGEGVFVRLLLGGKGPAAADLARLVAELRLGDRVRMLGYVPEEEKRSVLRRAWANLYTSPREGWGITNIEAAACGTPTIASDAPGLRESVRHEVTGLLVPHGDVTALAGAMRRLAESPAEVDRLGRGALEFARGFSWDEAAERTLDFLRAVARGPRPTSAARAGAGV
jgi:glycosyltransferase involved in cell wall biosynthesis